MSTIENQIEQMSISNHQESSGSEETAMMNGQNELENNGNKMDKQSTVVMDNENSGEVNGNSAESRIVDGEFVEKKEHGNGVKNTLNPREKSEDEGKEGKKKNPIGNVPLAKKQPPNSGRNTEGRVDVVCNGREIAFPRNLRFHQYSVKVVFCLRSRRNPGTEYSVEISDSQRKGEEYEKDMRRCRRVYTLVAETYDAFQEGGPFFYDSQNTLWSLTPLKTQGSPFTITEGVTAQRDFIQAKFILEDPSYTLKSEDIVKTVSEAPAQADKRLHQAVAILIGEGPNSEESIHTVGGSSHYFIGRDPLREIRQIHFREGDRRSAIGITRSIKTVEGVNGEGTLCMTNEIKVGMFYPEIDMPLLEFFGTFQRFHPNLDAAEAKIHFNHLKGLEIYLNYADSLNMGEDSKMIKISGFGKSPMDQMFEKDDGSIISVNDYFRQEYNIEIRNKRLFTIAFEWSRNKFHYFPPELLRIVPNQRVKDHSLSKWENEQLKRTAALKPHERFRATQQLVQKAALDGRNLGNLVKVSAEIHADGFVLSAPYHNFGDGFFKKMRLERWQIVFMAGEVVRGIEDALMDEMKQKQMDFAYPSFDYIGEKNIFDVFSSAKRMEVQLLVFILDRKHEYHAHIKALEQDYDILTMHILGDTARRICSRGGGETRKNVIQKLNMKLGGLNYQVVNPYLENENLLVIGFSLSKTQECGKLEITSVGYSANMMANAHQFCGGYSYVVKSKDIFENMIFKAVKTCLKTARAARKMKAEKVLVYFNGISEGEFAVVNEVYVKTIRDVFSSLKKDYCPELTVLAVSKKHNERLYWMKNGFVENLVPGTVVDNTIVSPVFNEFFHVGARAFQGTSKPVKYTVIHSSKDVNMEYLEELTNGLCHEHQIINTPTGLPTPLVVASECAKRGAANLAIREENNIRQGVRLNVDEMNERFSYDNKNLARTRFNA